MLPAMALRPSTAATVRTVLFQKSRVATIVGQPRRMLATASAAAVQHQSDHGKRQQPFYAGEPAMPSVKTAIPGPRSKELIKDMDTVFDTRALNMVTDYSRSFGNYIADADGNMLLDV
jgi:4-aminobutyrate aminotransferase/(S)-3-amino-2-methylpropionate transaminase